MALARVSCQRGLKKMRHPETGTPLLGQIQQEEVARKAVLFGWVFSFFGLRTEPACSLSWEASVPVGFSLDWVARGNQCNCPGEDMDMGRHWTWPVWLSTCPPNHYSVFCLQIEEGTEECLLLFRPFSFLLPHFGTVSTPEKSWKMTPCSSCLRRQRSRGLNS